MTDAEWTSSDLPVVSAAGEIGRCCTSCGTWSCWIGNAGDCLFHAYQHRDEMIAGVAPEKRTATKSARMTAGDEVCDGWRPIGKR